jgi:hypothetical protein
VSIISSLVGSLICIGAGVYLLLHGSPPIQIGSESGQSWLEIIAHGMGAYFIGKGILLAPQTWNAGEQVSLTKDLLYAVGRIADRANAVSADPRDDDTGEWPRPS